MLLSPRSLPGHKLPAPILQAALDPRPQSHLSFTSEGSSGTPREARKSRPKWPAPCQLQGTVLYLQGLAVESEVHL